jgi:hypothetical protein
MWKGEEMTQTLYAYMNKGKKNLNEKQRPFKHLNTAKQHVILKISIA